MLPASQRCTLYSEAVDVETPRIGIVECRNVGVREKAKYFEHLSRVPIDSSASRSSRTSPANLTPSAIRRKVGAEWDEETGLVRVKERSERGRSERCHTTTCTNWTPTHQLIQAEERKISRPTYFGANYVIPVSSNPSSTEKSATATRNVRDNEKVLNVNVVVNIIANSGHATVTCTQQPHVALAAATSSGLSKSKSVSYDDLVALSRQIEQVVHDAIQTKRSDEAVYAEPIRTVCLSTQQSSTCSVSSGEPSDLCRPILPAGVKAAHANASGVVLRPSSSRCSGFTRHSVNIVSASGGRECRATPRIDDRKLGQLKAAINAVFEASRRRSPFALRPSCFGALDADFSLSEEDAAEATDDCAPQTTDKRRRRDKKRRSTAERAALASRSSDSYEPNAHLKQDRMRSKARVIEWPKTNAASVVARRIALAKSISERTYATVEHYRSLKYAPSAHLFEFMCIVGMDVHDRTPRILFSHPENTQIAQVEEFAFPDKSTVQPCTQLQSEAYSFVMTREDGSRYFGFCRRCLPPESKECKEGRLPEVFCVVSSVGANFLYEQLLSEMERIRRVSWQFCCDFVKSAYDCQMPRLGSTVQVRLANPTSENGVVVFSRPSDDRLEQLELSYAFRLLGTENLMRVYGALLLERRVILTASRLSVLSAVGHTLLWLLYPFVWQHTFIPILPGCMIDVLDAPTPYLVGLLASGENLVALSAMKLDADVTVVDLDAASLVRSSGDEVRVLPKRMHKTVCLLLQQILARTDLRTVANVAILETFLRMYTELFADLPDYLVHSRRQGDAAFANDLAFDKDRFVKSIQSASVRSFVSWFCETQQFAVLVNDYLEMNNASAAVGVGGGGGKLSLASSQANKFFNRLYERRLTRRSAPLTDASSSESPRTTRKQTQVACASDSDSPCRQSASSSPFGTLAAKVKRAFLKQANTTS